MERELRIKSIHNGTVIDHIRAGQALNVLKILRITGASKAVISVAMNVPSKNITSKDIVKIEDRELASDEVDKIALIAPNATINIIRGYEVIEKHKVQLPDEIEGIIKCANPNCISNTKEPVSPKFVLHEVDPLQFRCFYCDRILVGDFIDYVKT